MRSVGNHPPESRHCRPALLLSRRPWASLFAAVLIAAIAIALLPVGTSAAVDSFHPAVKASRNYGLAAQDNRPPEIARTMLNQVLVEDGKGIELEMSQYFRDLDGDRLSYTVESTDPAAVQTTFVGGSSVLVVRPLAQTEGAAVSVTATDPAGSSVELKFTITVIAAATPPTPTPTPTPESTRTPTPIPTASPSPTPTPTPTPTPLPTPTSTPIPRSFEVESGVFLTGLAVMLVVVLAYLAVMYLVIRRDR